MTGSRLWRSTWCSDSCLQQLELHSEGVKGPVVACFSCKIVHGLGVHSLEVPHGGVGGMSRENLDSGHLNSTAAEELDATNPKGVTAEQFSSGSGLCRQPQLMGCCHDGGYHTFLGRWESRRLREKGPGR